MAIEFHLREQKGEVVVNDCVIPEFSNKTLDLEIGQVTGIRRGAISEMLFNGLKTEVSFIKSDDIEINNEGGTYKRVSVYLTEGDSTLFATLGNQDDWTLSIVKVRVEPPQEAKVCTN